MSVNVAAYPIDGPHLRRQTEASRALDRKPLYVAENQSYDSLLKQSAGKIAVFIAASPNLPPQGFDLRAQQL